MHALICVPYGGRYLKFNIRRTHYTKSNFFYWHNVVGSTVWYQTM